jgi:PAS domain S-box-containing protein
MSNKDLAQGIKDIRKHVDLLGEQSHNSSVDQGPILDEALEELRTSLEELLVAEEELRTQNEKLVQIGSEVDRERQRYHDLFESAPDSYIVTSGEGVILEANQAAAHLFSVVQKYLVGKPLATYIYQGDLSEFRGKLVELSRSRRASTKEIELRVISRKGAVHDVAMVVAPVFDHHDEPVAFRWLLRNITERKRIEHEIRTLNAELERRVAERTRELEAANRAKDDLLAREQQARHEAEVANHSKDEFLATLSHELRTPLNAILGWIHILRSQNVDSGRMTHGLEVIERNARSQAQIVEDILEVSRIVTGNLELQKEPLSLKPVLEAAIDSVQHLAEAKRINIVSSTDHEVGFVSGDPNRLQQVASNLLTNAIKFTPSGGEIRVRLDRAGDSAQFSVSDTGAGIEQDFLPHIFERFRQADSASRRKYGGLGLGLSIVQHIIRMHGGKVRATSEGKGEGATFTVELPLISIAWPATEKILPSQPDDRSSPKSDEPDLNGIWVIMIDDEPDAREMVKMVLEQWGAKVSAMETVSEVIDALAGEPGGRRPDVLVADIAMPNEDGYDLIRKVRKLGPKKGGAIPAIALTAYAAAEDRLRVLAEGYQMHVAKPVSLFDLAAVVSRLGRNDNRA